MGLGRRTAQRSGSCSAGQTLRESSSIKVKYVGTEQLKVPSQPAQPTVLSMNGFLYLLTWVVTAGASALRDLHVAEVEQRLAPAPLAGRRTACTRSASSTDSRRLLARGALRLASVLG